jgi:hypothetical protein
VLQLHLLDHVIIGAPAPGRNSYFSYWRVMTELRADPDPVTETKLTFCDFWLPNASSKAQLYRGGQTRSFSKCLVRISPSPAKHFSDQVGNSWAGAHEKTSFLMLQPSK